MKSSYGSLRGCNVQTGEDLKLSPNFKATFLERAETEKRCLRLALPVGNDSTSTRGA